MILNSDFYQKKRDIIAVAITVFFISSGILFLIKNDTAGKSLFMITAYIASYYSFQKLGSHRWQYISKGILLGLAAAVFLVLIKKTIYVAYQNEEWDFMCFYMQGQLGVHHLPFYDPNSFQILLQKVDFNFSFSESFVTQTFDVGMIPPPITMLLFHPIASLDHQTSRIVVSVFIFLFVIASSFLANIIFAKKERSVYSFLFIFIIISLLPGTSGTFRFNQTNFFLLFFLLLTLQHIHKPISGFYLALSLIIKPIGAFLILFFIITKNWKSVLYFVITVAILTAITGFIWGFQNVIGFFQSPPTQRYPQVFYDDSINQSLLGVLNRNLHFYSISQSTINLIFFIAAGIFAMLSCIASYRLKKGGDWQLAILPLILCMLIIYPSSLIPYMVFSIPVLLYFLFLKNGEKYIWVILLPALSFTRHEVFFMYLIFWIALFIISYFKYFYTLPFGKAILKYFPSSYISVDK